MKRKGRGMEGIVRKLREVGNFEGERWRGRDPEGGCGGFEI